MARHLKFPIVSMQNYVFLIPFESRGLNMSKCGQMSVEIKLKNITTKLVPPAGYFD